MFVDLHKKEEKSENADFDSTGSTQCIIKQRVEMKRVFNVRFHFDPIFQIANRRLSTLSKP